MTTGGRADKSLRTAALGGAILFGLLAGAGVIMLALLAPIGAVQATPWRAIAAEALLLVLAGVAAGITYHASLSLSTRYTWGSGMRWTLAAWTAVLTLFVMAPLAAHGVGLDEVDAAQLTRMTSGNAVSALALSGLLFGILMARLDSEYSTPLMQAASFWAALGLIGWVAFGDLGVESRLAVPDTPSDALHVLARAERDAADRPGDERAQLTFGIALTHLQRYADGVRALSRAESLAPSDAWPRNALGWALMQQGRFAEALPHLEAGQRLDTTYAKVAGNLAWDLMRLGRFSEAELAYRRAAHLDPSSGSIAYGYAWVLEKNDRTDMALRQARRAVALSPDNIGARLLAASLLRRKLQFGAAKEQLLAAHRAAPSAVPILLELALTEQLMGDSVSASTHFRDAWNRDSLVVTAHPSFSALRAAVH